jgi:hypothetical protein
LVGTITLAISSIGLIAFLSFLTAAISPGEGILLTVEIGGAGLFVLVGAAPAILAILLSRCGMCSGPSPMLPVLVVSFLAFSDR